MKLSKLIVVIAVLSVSLMAKGEEKAVKALDVKTPVLGESVVKAKYTLIHFWASADKASRMRAIGLEKELKSSKTKAIALVAVAFDPLKLAYDLSEDAKDGIYSDVYKTFKLRKSLSNYLVDASGKVVARDLTPESLAIYINEMK